jgi:sirohydrochlorin ferrochelatase
MNAVIYIAHGSGRGEANEKFIAFITEVMKKSSAAAVQAYGFLEHAEPSISQAIDACLEKGAKEITVVPVLLLPGIHANVDIPAEFTSYPDIVFRYELPLGVDDIIVDILFDRLAEEGFANSEEVAVLLVGHGSREPAAAVEFEKLARNLRGKIKGEVHSAFLTTSVFYHEKVEELSNKKVYILPFLLFSGGYTIKMKKRLAAHTDKIAFCNPVGFDEKLIRLIEKRVNEVRI